MTKQHLHIKDLCLISLFTATIAIMAQISIPMPIGVPMTMQTFAITLAGIVLGARNGALASIIYMLIGAIGLPVFANFTGGWQVLLGPTGGFILSFPIMAYIIGLGFKYRHIHKTFPMLAIALGTTLNLLCGVWLFSILSQTSFLASFAVSGLPYIPVTIIKAVLAYLLGNNIQKRLRRTFSC